MLEGRKVYLTSIEKDDLEQLRNWRNQENYRKHFREYREISRDMQMAWYESKVLKDNSTIMFSIRSKETDELLGCCGLCYINWVNRNADLSLYIGYENSYIDDKGYAEEACSLMFDYGFKELALNKIWTEIYEFDEKKLKLYDKLGFKKDGFLREQYYHDGKWWGSHMLSLLCREWLDI